MIWVDGWIVPDDALTISALDRTFEHGLGLFETLRTWGGHPVLLDRHLSRMRLSASMLSLGLGGLRFPDADAVAALRAAEHMDGDSMLRITVSGGRGEGPSSRLWMRATPLPPPYRHGGAIVSLGRWDVSPWDPMTQHKVLNYWLRRMAHEEAKQRGYDEVLSSTSGRYWEGSRTNLFVIKGQTLRTPSVRGPIVPGIMRGLVLELARQLPLEIEEDGILTRRSIFEADEVFLTNSVRGIIPVSRVFPHLRDKLSARTPTNVPWARSAPGVWTHRLSILVTEWLNRGGVPS